MADDATILVGSKPVMNYVLAVVTQFHSGSPVVTLRARGKAINTAVDAAEIVRNRFLQGAEVKDVRIGTEQVSGDRGTVKVSTITIAMAWQPAEGADASAAKAVAQAAVQRATRGA